MTALGNKKIRLLNVTVLLDPKIGGGTAERTFQMSRALLNECTSVTILTNDIGITADRKKSLGNVGLMALPVIIKRFPVYYVSWAKIKKMINSVDVIHLMGHWNPINILVYVAARRLKVPYVVCPAGELPLFGRSSLIKRIYNLLIGYRMIQNAAGHVAITPDEFEAYERYGIDRSQVVLIPNGINEADFQVSQDQGFVSRLGLNGVPFILFMGRLNPIKGPDLLLDAFCRVCRQFSEYHLVFAGPDGGMLNQLKETVKAFHIQDRVHFAGYISGQDKTCAYAAADFLVIPSRQEAMSIVVLEAGIIKTPVLLTDCCGFDEVDSMGGGLVVRASVEGLEKGLIQMMGKKAVLHKMGELLYDFVRKNYTWDLISTLYMDLFRKAAEKNVQ